MNLTPKQLATIEFLNTQLGTELRPGDFAVKNDSPVCEIAYSKKRGPEYQPIRIYDDPRKGGFITAMYDQARNFAFDTTHSRSLPDGPDEVERKAAYFNLDNAMERLPNLIDLVNQRFVNDVFSGVPNHRDRMKPRDVYVSLKHLVEEFGLEIAPIDKAEGMDTSITLRATTDSVNGLVTGAADYYAFKKTLRDSMRDVYDTAVLDDTKAEIHIPVRSLQNRYNETDQTRQRTADQIVARERLPDSKESVDQLIEELRSEYDSYALNRENLGKRPERLFDMPAFKNAFGSELEAYVKARGPKPGGSWEDRTMPSNNKNGMTRDA